MSTCSQVVSPRRFYLLKSQAARFNCDIALSQVWLAKQEAESGTSLPGDFPTLTELAAAHYTTVEDLTGAGTQELVEEARLTTKQAQAVQAALAAL